MEFEYSQFSDFMPKSEQEKAILKNRFIQSFIIYVNFLYKSSDNHLNKYKLRQDILNMKCMEHMIQIRYNGRSITTFRPVSFDRCARITTCVRYHMFDIEQVYYKIIENKGVFKCPECETIARETKEIVPDYFSYLYYQCTEGACIDIVFQRENIGNYMIQELKQDIFESENKVIKGNEIITMVINNYSPMFRKIIQEKNNIYNYYKRIRNDGDLNMQKTIHKKKIFSKMGDESVNLVSLITGKRMRSGVLHLDCEHPEIYIFDLEGLLLSLFQFTLDQKIFKPKQSVRCIYCMSKFTAQNIFQKAILFGKIFEIITKLPLSFGRAHFKYNVLIIKQQKKIEKVKQRLTSKYPKRNVDFALRKMSRSIISFWNKQDRDKYDKCIIEAFETVKTKIGKGFRKTIDYNKVFYPVRCNKCKSLDFVDVWDELIHFVQLKDLETIQDYRCLTCKQNKYDDDEEELQNSIYLDLEVYTLMQYNLRNIVFDSLHRRWLPDIDRIQFREGVKTDPVDFLVMYLMLNNKAFSTNNFPYYRNKFVIRTKTRPNTYCFILKQCIDNKDNLQKLIDHIIYLETGDYQFKVRCPKCGILPTSILNVNYDPLLTGNLRDRKNKWNQIDNIFEQHRPIKIIQQFVVQKFK